MTQRKTVALFTSLPLDSTSPDPLYRQLYETVRDAILQGRLRPGLRLPATRTLADELGVSRNTVMNAFDQLLAEGYVEGRVGSGTYVSSALPEAMLHISSPRTGALTPAKSEAPLLSRRGRVLASHPSRKRHAKEMTRPFQGGAALDAFPFDIWSRLAARRWRMHPTDLMGYGDYAGYRPLREAIAAYVGMTRAVHCEPEQVLVISGSQRAIDLTARLLLEPRDAVWMEDPGYREGRSALLGAEARVIPVPVDDEGLDVAAGEAQCANARLVYVTPSHQYPLGVTMSLARRLALLDWASRAGAWIIEDDFASEYRYGGKPLASLQGLDQEGRVIYLGTFRRVLYPTLRLGYLIVPPTLIDAFVSAQTVVDGESRSLDQAVLADFLSEGHFTRHIRRMRTLYEERQAALVKAAQRDLDGVLDVSAAESGMHLVGWLPEAVQDQAASRQAAEHGLVTQPLSSFRISCPLRNGLLLGYTAFTPRQIREAVRRLAVAFRSLK